MPFEGSGASYYRQRAAEVREKAETCHLRDIREQLIRIAEQFEALALQVERRITRL